MKKEKYLHLVFAVAVLLVVGYYLVNLLLPVHLPESEKSTIISTQTGDAISKEDVAKISQKQTKERRTYVLTGKVESKSNTSLQIGVPTNSSTSLFEVKFSPKMVFLAEVPLPGYEKDSSAIEEQKISLAEVKVGDTITVVFPKGIALSMISKTEPIEIDNLVVNMPQKAVAGKD